MYLKSFLKAVDLFGHPIQLTFNQQEAQRSIFGGINTLILLSLFIGIAFQGFLNIMMRANITSYTTDIYSNQPPYIDISPDAMNFAVSFTPTSLNVWDQMKYFKLEVFQGVYTRDLNGVTTKIKRAVKMVPCQLNTFTSSAQTVLLGLTSNVSGFLCPKSDDVFAVSGKFSSTNFTFLNFKLSKCKNSTNVTCASKEAIDKAFTSAGGKVYLNFYLMNNIINIYDFDNTVNPFMDDRIYLLINRDSYKEKNFYFTQQKIFTDSSIITTSYKEDIDTFIFDNNFDESELTFNEADGTYASVYFRSNFLAKYHYRTFEKLGKFVSYIGGFWSVLFLFFSIIGKRYNKHLFLVKIANQLYDFENPNPESKEPKIRPNDPSQKKEFKKIKLVDKNEKESNRGETTENSRINQNIRLYLKKKNEYKLMKGLKYFFECFFKSSEKEKYKSQKKLQNRAFIEIYKDVDIIHLLKKMKQIDKLKSLLLNETQICLFDFDHKTKINLSRQMRNSSLRFLEKMESRRMNVKQDTYEIGFKDVKNYYESYQLLKKDANEKNATFNSRIINLIDIDLLKIFQNISDTSNLVENFNFFNPRESLLISNTEKSENRVKMKRPNSAKKSVK